MRLVDLERERSEAIDRVNLLLALQEAFSQISITRSPDDVIATMLRTTRNPLGFSRAIYFRVDRSNGIEAHLQIDGSETIEKSYEIPDVGEGGGILALIRGPFLTATGTACELSAPLVDVRDSYVLAKLSSSDGIFGLLYVDGPSTVLSHEPQREFETELVRTLATIAAVSIENSRLLNTTQDLAMRDPLTGLFNRRAFSERLLYEIERSRSSGRSLTYVMIDIDDFKRINDSHGHAQGDLTLKHLGETLVRSSRQIDTVGRYAGDEFVMLLSDVDRALARLLVARVSSDLRAQHLYCSLGAALFPDDAYDASTLLAAADQALYATKQSGKNGYTFAGDKPTRLSSIPT